MIESIPDKAPNMCRVFDGLIKGIGGIYLRSQVVLVTCLTVDHLFTNVLSYLNLSIDSSEKLHRFSECEEYEDRNTVVSR